MTCTLCGDACRDADLAALLDPRLMWLWTQLAATADRRGDPDLVTGLLRITVPTAAEQRSAAVGLLGGRTLTAGQTKQIQLADLCTRLRVRGVHLTPGAVAAHAAARPLALRARDRAARVGREAELEAMLTAALADLRSAAEPLRELSAARAWAHLRRSGWAARLCALPDAERLLRTAVTVLVALPAAGARVDRRRLASDHAYGPHALDDGTPLAGLTLALVVAAGMSSPGVRPRIAWEGIGVDWDDLTGGLITVGIYPAGWVIPPHVAVTLPPRELAVCEWPTPASVRTVFVTENPSVAAAAADLVVNEGIAVRLICTSGTPSAGEVAALARLANAGWHLRVRADFDPAGLAHVTTLLAHVGAAAPWRMGAADYAASVSPDGSARGLLDPRGLPDSPWEPMLSETMRARAAPAYEEALLPLLLTDLRTDGYGGDI